MSQKDIIDFYDPATITTGFETVDPLHPSGHTGIDYAHPEGTNIPALFGGKVTDAGYDSTLGNYIVIQSGGGGTATYGHMESASPLNVGDSVSMGQNIGIVGSTGYSDGPHLHLTLRSPDGNLADPLPLVDQIRKAISVAGGSALEDIGSAAGDVFGAGKSVVSGAKTAVDASVSMAKTIADVGGYLIKMLKWLTNQGHWWAIGFIGGGVFLIIIGVQTYFISTPTGQKVAKEAAIAAA